MSDSATNRRSLASNIYLAIFLQYIDIATDVTESKPVVNLRSNHGRAQPPPVRPHNPTREPRHPASHKNTQTRGPTLDSSITGALSCDLLESAVGHRILNR